MINTATGNLLHAPVEALVNPVNCVGVMGKGLALQFKSAYPTNFSAYRQACSTGSLHPGTTLVHDLGVNAFPRYLINVPTKRHWRDSSRIEDIRAGLAALIEAVRFYTIRSIAIPPLGCGLGGLAWDTVKPLIESACASIPNVNVLLYEPVIDRTSLQP